MREWWRRLMLLAVEKWMRNRSGTDGSGRGAGRGFGTCREKESRTWEMRQTVIRQFVDNVDASPYFASVS